MNDREKLKQELLEEIKQEYYLKPKSSRLEVTDIFDKYKDKLLAIEGYDATFGKTRIYTQFEAIKQAIRKVACMHFNVQQMKYIKPEQYEDFRNEIERIIKEYILGEN